MPDLIGLPPERDMSERIFALSMRKTRYIKNAASRVALQTYVCPCCLQREEQLICPLSERSDGPGEAWNYVGRVAFRPSGSRIGLCEMTQHPLGTLHYCLSLRRAKLWHTNSQLVKASNCLLPFRVMLASTTTEVCILFMNFFLGISKGRIRNSLVWE